MSESLPARVWVARRKAGMKPEDFRKMLREDFVPATSQWLTPLGLQAYFPTLVPEDAVRASDPHEVALVFHTSAKTYSAATQTTIGRLYNKAHGLLFEKLHSNWPTLWSSGTLTPLGIAFHSAIPPEGMDWNAGQLAVYMLRWPVPLSGADWVERLCLPSLRALPCTQQWITFARDDYIIVWAHLPPDIPVSAETLRQNLAQSSSDFQVVFAHIAREEIVTASAFNPFPGVTFTADETLHVVLRALPAVSTNTNATH